MTKMDTDWEEYFSPKRIAGRERELLILKHMMPASEGGIVNIYGGVGYGKTSLAFTFAHDNKDIFPGGIYHISAYNSRSLKREISTKVGSPSNRYLIIIDDLLEGNYLPEIMAIRRQRPSASLLLVSISRIGDELNIPSLEVTGLRSDSFTSLVLDMVANGHDPHLATKLFRDLEGNPLALRFIADLMETKSSTFGSLSKDIELFRYPTLLDAKGNPLREGSPEEKTIITDVRIISEEMLRKLNENPDHMHELSPRRFEELVAELLSRHGYGVTLTPASKDGGKDIYAAKKDALGTFTYIVECKKYAPANKVGVRILRELGGVVSSERYTAGVLATTSFFTKDAVEYQKSMPNQISLKDFYGIRTMLEESIR